MLPNHINTITRAPMPTTTADQKIVALEQKVANLELKLNTLLSVLTVEGNGQKAKLKANTLELESTGDMKIKSAKSIDCESQQNSTFKTTGILLISGAQTTVKASSNARMEAVNVEVNADSQAKLEGSNVVVNGSSATAINGGVVKFNNGSQKVARVADVVISGIIATGCSKVLA